MSAHALETLAAGRFEVVRQLGMGGMGAVYEARDRHTGALVAIKSLGQIDAITVRAFKAEFRDFQHLHHPNLVALDEFFHENGDWYFSMELLDGSEFLTYVRHSQDPGEGAPTRSLGSIPPHSSVSRVKVYPGVIDLQRLAHTLRQLSAALAHVHAAGKVHRDVKSSNVLITGEGRVVLLDFGIAADIERKDVQLAGTPLYMAPELYWQAATPAADWFAVGVLLYQALTGSDPWQQRDAAAMVSKRTAPTAPIEIEPSVPRALSDLCLQLLAPAPEQRAGLRAILQWAESDGTSIEAPAVEESEPELFIGRERELAELHDAFDDVQAEHAPLLVYVRGESGIGKSALVRDFGARIAARAVVLRGRVLEGEVVPYKSIDGIVDALCEHLVELGYTEAKPLLPEHFNIVADTFPVLRRAACVAELPRTTIPDPTERRALMFGALKETLRRVAQDKPLVLCVDDLHWSDADSIQFWKELLRGPDAPQMLVIGTVRDDKTGSLRPSVRVSSIEVRSTLLPLPVPDRTLTMQRMSEQEAMAYVSSRSVESARILQIDDGLVRAANGHPLFIDQLLRYRGELDEHELTLEGVLAKRIAELTPTERRYLQLASASAKPLSRARLARAAGLSHGQGLRAFKALSAARLLRSGRAPGADGEDWVDPLHYRIRNASLSECSGDELAALHRAIATATEADGRLDAEHLMIEWRDAGELERAATYAKQAAEVAWGALAFQKAASFFANALHFSSSLDPRERAELEERLGRSLRNAGQAKAAADVFLRLAPTVDAERSFHLRCEAAELLLRSGFIDDGTRVLDTVLADAQVSLPRGAHAVAKLAWFTGKRKLLGYRWELNRTPPSKSEIRKMDAMWSATSGLGPVDQIPAYACGAEFIDRALRAGNPVWLGKALGSRAVADAATGNLEAGLTLVEEAEHVLEIAKESAPELAAVPASAALTRMLCGRWREALERAQSGQRWIQSHCVGAFGELAFAEEAELWSLAMTGDFSALVRRQGEILSRARERDDLYAAFAAVSGIPNLAYLAADDWQRAIAEATKGLRLWSQRGIYLQHAFDAYARAQALLYAGEAADADACLRAFDRARRTRVLLIPQPLAPLFTDLRGRIALRLAVEGKRRKLDVADTCARELRGSRFLWARGLGILLAAGVAHLNHDKYAIILAKEATRVLASHDMIYLSDVAALYACAISHEQPSEGLRARVQRGLSAPQRFALLFAPDLPASGVDGSARAPQSS